MTPFIEPFASIWWFVIGTVIGSFLNVCIYRLPREKSIISPGSACPECGAPVRWYQNIPLFSWILLRGKCANCGTGISVRYPFVELVSGVIVLIAWLYFGPSLGFAIAAPFALARLVLFFTDYDLKLLPDAITLTGFVTGMAVAWWNPFLEGQGLERIWWALVGACLGSGFLWATGAIYGRLRGVEAMGMGDVKMMALVGAFTGWQGVLFTIFGASVVGAVVGVALVPLRGRSMQDTLPFGCFLAPAAVMAMLYARDLIAWYLRMVLPPTI